MIALDYITTFSNKKFTKEEVKKYQKVWDSLKEISEKHKVSIRGLNMITSLLDNDFYKFTMMNAVLHQARGTDVEYEFKCRNNAYWTPKIYNRILEEVNNYCGLRFAEDELDYLSTFDFFHQDFIDFLRLYKPNRNHIDIFIVENDLVIEIKGSWLLTILLEVPLLAIVNECYFEHAGWNNENDFTIANERLHNKIKIANESGIKFADFGTRRRISNEWQDYIVKTLSEFPTDNFVGTSNVLLAKKYGVKAIGTQAHEWFMAFQGMNVKLKEFQKKALQVWVDEYRGDLGIALSDTVGIDAFLKDFDKYFAKLYDGVRHDSGDPVTWGYKIIEHYRSFGIDPKTKTIVFSDGLTFELARSLNNIFKDEINVSFGIGTNLTNDFENIKPLQIVIKMTSCNGNPVAKLSDSPGKAMCKDDGFLTYLKSVFNVGEVK